MALLGPRAVVGVLGDALGAPCRAVHGAHGGGAPGRAWTRAHPPRGHAGGAAGAGVGHELVVVGRTPHLENKNKNTLMPFKVSILTKLI